MVKKSDRPMTPKERVSQGFDTFAPKPRPKPAAPKKSGSSTKVKPVSPDAKPKPKPKRKNTQGGSKSPRDRVMGSK